MKNLTVVADWANDDLAKKEFTSSLLGEILEQGQLRIDFVASYHSSIHTAFLTQQIVQTEERLGIPDRNVIFLNTDTREHTDDKINRAEGSPFVIAILYSKLIVCGPNAGYSLSLIKDQIQQFFIYKGIEKGSQFRSRDLFPKVIAQLLMEKQDMLEIDELELSGIPDLTGFFVGHVDNYGNIKTTIPSSVLQSKLHGDLVKITIGNVTREVFYTHNLFGEKQGILVIASGSSGKENDRFLELSVRIGPNSKPGTGLLAGRSTASKSAAEHFNNPKPGNPIRSYYLM